MEVLGHAGMDFDSATVLQLYMLAPHETPRQGHSAKSVYDYIYLASQQEQPRQLHPRIPTQTALPPREQGSCTQYRCLTYCYFGCANRDFCGEW
jgi:hypothetical protein